MGHTKISAITVVFGVFIWLVPSVEAQVNCDVDPPGSLQAAINAAPPVGAPVTITVSGTCNENIFIGENKHRLTLDGGGTATINGLDQTRHTVNVRGRGITIKRFTLTGGINVIIIPFGGAAEIDGNTIQGALRHGIIINKNSYGRVLNNTIQDNGLSGVLVRQASGADIFNNDITRNPIGVIVSDGGSADVSGNHIFSNTGDGVLLLDNSHIRFSDDPDDMIVDVIELNGGSGVRCDRGGSISGNPVSFGVGNPGGDTSIASNCIVQAGVFP